MNSSPNSSSATTPTTSPRTPKIFVSHSVLSVDSRKSNDSLSLASSDSLPLYQLNGLQANHLNGSYPAATRKGTITVRNALLISFISLSVFLCGLILYFSWMNAMNANQEFGDVCEESTFELALKLHNHILRTIDDTIKSYMMFPLLSNTLFEFALDRGDLTATNFDKNMAIIWDNRRSLAATNFTNFSTLMVHSPTGSFLGVDQLGGPQLFWIRQNNTLCTTCEYEGGPLNPAVAYRYLFDAMDAKATFNLSKGVLHDTLDYDPRTRPWYQNIYTTSINERIERPVWSEIYAKIATEKLTLSMILGQCVTLTEECELILGVDLLLNFVNEFIDTLLPTESTRVLLLDESGMLIAATNSSVAFEDVLGVVHRYSYADLSDPLLLQMTTSLIEEFGSIGAVHGQGTLPPADGITTSYAVYSDGFGIRWVIAVGVNNDDFLGNSRAKHSEIEQKQVQTSIGLLTFSLLMLVVGTIIFLLITSQITSPLKHLNRELTRVAQFQFDNSGAALDETVNVMSWNTKLQELASIGNSFDIMRHNMHCFSRYIPPSVVSMIVQGHLTAALGVEAKHITLFFSDLIGFTTIAESLPPRVLIEVLGSYLDQMSRIIMENEGTVGEFVGDGILAFWNSPYDVAEHQARACDAALMMQQALAEARAIQLDEYQQMGLKTGKPELRARMGLTAGRVLHGNLGTPDRMKFGVVGDAVNTASRLEGLCGFYGVGTLVSQQVEKEVRGLYLLRHVDRVVVKGKKRTTELFELLCKRKDVTPQLEKYASDFHAIMHYYWDRQFKEALFRIAQYLEEFPNDTAAQVIARRCEYFLLNPPPKTWNGVYRHNDKAGGGMLESESDTDDKTLPPQSLATHTPHSPHTPEVQDSLLRLSHSGHAFSPQAN